MTKQLKYKKWFINSGDTISGTIKGQKVEGKLFITTKWFYFCQNSKNGTNSPDKLGYAYSWRFKTNGGRLSQDVEITNVKKCKKITKISHKKVTQIKKTLTITNDGNFYTIDLVKGIQYSTIKHGILPLIHKEIVMLFKSKFHPDCCGSEILYNFCESDISDYSRYKNLTKKDISVIKEIIDSTAAAKIVHLSHVQNNAITLLEKLDFKLQYEYTNNNSSNTIKVYHYNP